jgi:hypothetical protein
VIATESRPRRARRALTTAAALVLAVSLAGCTSHATDFIYTPAQGVNNRDGDVDVLNALIVSAEEGEGRLIAGLANNDLEEGDELTGVSGAGEDAGIQVQLEGGETEIRAGGFLQLAEDDAARITVSGDAIQAGAFVRVTLEFERAEPVEVHVPVIEPGEDFADVVGATPSPPGETESPTGDAESPTGETESPAASETESEE